MSVGVIGHVMNPTRADAVAMATTAESAGADWIGMADAFWWRDVWMQLVAVAEATSTIEIGPAMTNPYLRHPFHTASALASLQEVAGSRVFVGIAAGGSEVTGAADVPRLDAPERVTAMIELLRRVAGGGPLDPLSGRALDIALEPVPVLVAGRGRHMLRTAGEHADRVLLWSIPDSDLGRSVALVQEGVAQRHPARPEPDLTWAPLVAHDEATRESILNAAVYASINTTPAVREGWGLDADKVAAIRAALVGGGSDAAIDLVPAAALEDLVVQDPDAEAVAARGRQIGATSIVVPCYDPTSLPDHLAWARAVEAGLDRGEPALS